jgi:Cu(I)/Ag(I) efflux system membrane protein CusA/SilA
MMTVATIVIGLLPVVMATGTGAEIMSRIAAPMVGGMVSALVLALLVLPVLYAHIRWPEVKRLSAEKN